MCCVMRVTDVLLTDKYNEIIHNGIDYNNFFFGKLCTQNWLNGIVAQCSCDTALDFNYTQFYLYTKARVVIIRVLAWSHPWRWHCHYSASNSIRHELKLQTYCMVNGEWWMVRKWVNGLVSFSSISLLSSLTMGEHRTRHMHTYNTIQYNTMEVELIK